MAYGAAAAAVVGTYITIQAQNKEARAKSRAARENAKLKRLQALEVLDRADINKDVLIKQAAQLKGKQRTVFGGRGIDVSTGSALDVVEETDSMVAEQIALELREANWTADQLRRGADLDITQAKQISEINKWRNISTFLSGAGTAFAAGSKGSS